MISVTVSWKTRLEFHSDKRNLLGVDTFVALSLEKNHIHFVIR